MSWNLSRLLRANRLGFAVKRNAYTGLSNFHAVEKHHHGTIDYLKKIIHSIELWLFAKKKKTTSEKTKIKSRIILNNNYYILFFPA